MNILAETHLSSGIGGSGIKCPTTALACLNCLKPLTVTGYGITRSASCVDTQPLTGAIYKHSARSDASVTSAPKAALGLPQHAHRSGDTVGFQSLILCDWDRPPLG